MKKYLFIILSVIFLAACGSEGEESNADKDPVEKDEVAKEKVKEKETKEVADVDSESSEENDSEDVIDTSMYEYSTEVEMTDAMDINEHITLMINMNDNLDPGMAFMHATNQTYDFLLQDGIEEAKTIGVNIILNGQKIAMYTVNTDNFHEDDNESMANLVLEASEIDMATEEVKDFAKNMDMNLE